MKIEDLTFGEATNLITSTHVDNLTDDQYRRLIERINDLRGMKKNNVYKNFNLADIQYDVITTESVKADSGWESVITKNTIK